MRYFTETAKYLFVICTITLTGCNKDSRTGPEDNGASPNILLIIADDMGKDATAGFAEGNVKPNTPNIDGIRNKGVSFNNFWVYPTCSPTRASILTGKYGYRTGVKWANDLLGSSEPILHQYLKENTEDAYATALVGKWHLSGNENTMFNPETLGMDYYAGLLRGGVESYYQWMLTEDGHQSTQTAYITEKFTGLAIDWIKAQDRPWFLWLAYTAPHTPFHVPPAEMHTQGNLPEYMQGISALPYYLAAIEAMDFQIGRLLNSLPDAERENTVIIFIGDNGTPNLAAQFPYSNSTVKGTLYQGGINTPLFVSGPGITRIGEQDDHLVGSTDLFATIAEVAGISSPEINDSKSFKPLFSGEDSNRDFQYSEMNDGASDLWAISDGQYKLIVNANGGQEMYDLSTDPYEGNDLLAGILSSGQLAAKERLQIELDRIRD
ncbi:MAG: sulfatase-like hydrolase/transferase [Phaeodactylibacter sp.]|nr:sulfatase-like hydrolase/transferase [Phaeodactylibacter sp.]MCB9276223.1 sulfatase-like hydrolase/transferase [Lewinellaceae bacterium]